MSCKYRKLTKMLWFLTMWTLMGGTISVLTQIDPNRLKKYLYVWNHKLHFTGPGIVNAQKDLFIYHRIYHIYHIYHTTNPALVCSQKALNSLFLINIHLSSMFYSNFHLYRNRNCIFEFTYKPENSLFSSLKIDLKMDHNAFRKRYLIAVNFY